MYRKYRYYSERMKTVQNIQLAQLLFSKFQLKRAERRVREKYDYNSIVVWKRFEQTFDWAPKSTEKNLKFPFTYDGHNRSRTDHRPVSIV